jgi:hypothetical protein
VRIVVNAAVAFGSTTLLQSTLGRSWTFAPQIISGGSGELVYSLITSNDSIAVNPSTGQISVTNQIEVGTYLVTLIATDEFLERGSVQISITINPLMTFTPQDSIVTTSGLAVTSSPITVTGGTQPRIFTITGTNLSINQTSGAITVNANKVAGTYIETITVTDSVGAVTEETITIQVNGELTIAQGSNITTTVGRSDSSTLYTATGGTGTRIFTISGSNPGITVDQSGRVFVAETATPGTFLETVTVTDALGVSKTRNITIIINQTVDFPITGNLATTFDRLRYFDSVVVTGGTGPFTYTFTGVNGALVELNSSSGRITVKAGLPVGTYKSMTP